ncbi:MAG: hypothetical protein QM784_09180 [Polyangiaceae bacterium]
MTSFMMGTAFARAEHHVVVALVSLLVTSCIDVGHESEVGCKVDMTEPGCTNSGGSPARGGSTGKGGNTGTSTVKSGGATSVAGSAGQVTNPLNETGGSSASAAGTST